MALVGQKLYNEFRMDLRRHKPPFVVIRGVSIILRFRDAKMRARTVVPCALAIGVGASTVTICRSCNDSFFVVPEPSARAAREGSVSRGRAHCPRSHSSELVSSRMYVVHLYHVHVHTELTLNRPVL